MSSIVREGYVYFAPAVEPAEAAGELARWFGGGGFLFGARPDWTELTYADPGHSDPLLAWSEGRLFNTRQELRWQQRGAAYALWLLGEERALQTGPPGPVAWQQIEGPWLVTGAAHPPYYLWGSYNPGWTGRATKNSWIEVRIPRPLHYPAKPPAPEGTNFKTEQLFARLGHLAYHAPGGGVQFTRLTEVK